MDEVPRADIQAVTGHLPAELDAVAPAGWRGFALRDGERVIHTVFLTRRASGLLLFRGHTVPDRRGQGAFRAMVGWLAAELARCGETHIDSSCSLDNRASLRAQQAAGFEVLRHERRIRLFGCDLGRWLPRRLR